MRVWVGGCVGLGVFVALHGPAFGVCGEGPAVSFVPYGDGAAPRNAHVLLTVAADLRRPGAKEHFTLRTAPARGAPGSNVPVTVRESASGEVVTVEVVPEVLLEGHTRYEVHLEAPGDTTTTRAPSRLVATFRTTDRIDRVAPTFGGIRMGARQALSLECPYDGITLVAVAPTDDLSPTEQLRFGVWFAGDDGVVHYEAPPSLVVPAEPNLERNPEPGTVRVSLGTSLRRDFVTPSDRAALRLGVQAIDLAGNRSAPSEVTVRLQPPSTMPKR